MSTIFQGCTLASTAAGQRFAAVTALSLCNPVCLTCFCGMTYRVDGASMQPCLNPTTSRPSDWVLVEKFSIKWLGNVSRGEVVVLWWVPSLKGWCLSLQSRWYYWVACWSTWRQVAAAALSAAPTAATTDMQTAAPPVAAAGGFSVAEFSIFCVVLLLCRAPDNPHQQIIKRLLAVEGDTIVEDTATGATAHIPQVRSNRGQQGPRTTRKHPSMQSTSAAAAAAAAEVPPAAGSIAP